MVFIFIGAVKAAKAAKLEYEKDKKRKAPIAPVDGSSARFRDGADHWYGPSASASAPVPAPTSSAPHTTSPSSTTAISAWARQTAPASPPSSASVSDDPPQPAPASPDSHPNTRPRPASSPFPASVHPSSSTASTTPARHSASHVALPPSVAAAAAPRKHAAARTPAPAPEGSFEAASVRPSAPDGSSDIASAPAPRKRSPAPASAPDGSFDAARRAPVVPDGDATDAQPSWGVPRVTQVRRTEDKCVDGSFAAAMQTQGEGQGAATEGRPRRRPVVKAQGVGEDAAVCGSAMPATTVRKLRRRATVGGEGRAGAEQRVPTAGTAAYPAGSTAKRRGAGGVGNSNVGDERAVMPAAAVESCMRKEGSMKKRVTRR